MFKKKSVLLSLVIALVTAAVVTQVVWAMTTLSEGSLTRLLGPTSSPIYYSSGACVGGSCRYLNQNSVNPSVYRWDTTPYGQNDWYAYIPTIGQAAVRYGVYPNENWSVVVNQANAYNQGQYLYIGYSDYFGSKALFLGNTCVSGWGCFGYPVYWDNMGYDPH